MIAVIVMGVSWIILVSVRTGINPDGGVWFDFSWIKKLVERKKENT